MICDGGPKDPGHDGGPQPLGRASGAKPETPPYLALLGSRAPRFLLCLHPSTRRSESHRQSLSQTMANRAPYFHTSDELADTFWPEVETKLSHLKTIILEHFGSTCTELSLLDEGSYARAYRATLCSGTVLVVRILLPVCDTVKTQAEVATMDAIRGTLSDQSVDILTNTYIARTTIPVPIVYLYCSTRNNPVGAEWIIMQYMPGQCLGDCFETLDISQKRRTAKDLAAIIHSLYSITATHCGSLLSDCTLSDAPTHHYGESPTVSSTVASATTAGRFVVGPANDFAFTESLESVHAQSEGRGPFHSERRYLEAVAFSGIPPGPPLSLKFRRYLFERVLEIYDTVRALYTAATPPGFVASSDNVFHFSHGDISGSNLLIDPATGAITAVLDWEAAGFRPAWLAAKAGSWFDDDDQRFVMSYYQDAPERYEGDTQEDAKLRQYFRAQMGECSPELLWHFDKGAELRSIFGALSEHVPSVVSRWMEKYQKYGWDETERGSFPFPMDSWIMEVLKLYKVCVHCSSP